MTDNIKKDVVSYLNGVRTVSVQNLALLMNAKSDELLPLLEKLADEGHVRFGGPSCHSECTNCSTDLCENPQDRVRSENSIIISMMKQSES
jgi:predicted aldo/keto reductase-like oxidoreductase